MFSNCFLSDEKGAHKIEMLLNKANENKIKIFMHKINILEIYYGVYRSLGKIKANKILRIIYSFPIEIISELDDTLLLESGRIKATYSLSLADSIVVGISKIKGYILTTSDHHELDIVETPENLKVFWFR